MFDHMSRWAVKSVCFYNVIPSQKRGGTVPTDAVLTLLFLFPGYNCAEEAEPCWIQALPLPEQRQTP